MTQEIPYWAGSHSYIHYTQCVDNVLTTSCTLQLCVYVLEDLIVVPEPDPTLELQFQNRIGGIYTCSMREGSVLIPCRLGYPPATPRVARVE